MGAFVLPSLEIRFMAGTRFSRTITRSLAMTLVDLFQHRLWFPLGMLGLFSVVVPAGKLACTFWLVYKMARLPLAEVYTRYRRLIGALTSLASYQLIDLYVGVLFIAFFNSDSADAELLGGFSWFFCYCLISLASSELLAGAFHDFASDDGWSQKNGETHTLVPTEDTEALGAACGGGSTPATTALLQARAGRAEGQAAQGPPALLDARAVLLFSAGFLAMLGACVTSDEPLLEVRTLWSEVAVDRSTISALGLFRRCLRGLTPLHVTAVLILMNVVLPLVYIVLLLAWLAVRRASGPQRAVAPQLQPTDGGHLLQAPAGCNRDGTARFLKLALEVVRAWATTDVFALAALIFLFTVQDQHTLTMAPEGSYEFYLFLGAGFSFFFLRWFVEGSAAASGVPWRFLLLAGVWGSVCLLIFTGVPGASPHFEFPTLDSVCQQVLPVVDATVRLGVPAAYGDCRNNATAPPQPCKGDGLLLNTTNDGGFIQAVWLGGINTLHLDTCKIRKDEAVFNQTLGEAVTKYHLTIGGAFRSLRLFLNLKQCSPFGCTRMHSANHCCGDDIRFQLTFALSCAPSRGLEAFREVVIDGCEIGAMLIEKKLLERSWYNLAVDAVDIAPQVEPLVQNHIRDFMSAAQIFWAGRGRHIPDLLNLIISYNVPARAGSC